MQEEIMKPWLYSLENRKRSCQVHAFNLDIIEYEEAHQAEENYLSEGFENRFKYPLCSFVFLPREKVGATSMLYALFAAADEQPIFMH